jgi:hypothetical protein
LDYVKPAHTDNSDRIEIIAVGTFGWQSCHPMKTVVFVLPHAFRSCMRIRLAEVSGLHHRYERRAA